MYVASMIYSEYAHTDMTLYDVARFQRYDVDVPGFCDVASIVAKFIRGVTGTQ